MRMHHPLASLSPALPFLVTALGVGVTNVWPAPGALGSRQPATQEGSASPLEGLTLELESLDGSLRHIPPGQPVLEDPRAEEAWIVRVLGPRPRRSSTGKGEGQGAAPAVVSGAEITLLGGDLLRGRILSGGGETVLFELAGGAEVPLAIDAMRRIVVPDHLPEGSSVPLEEPSEGDRIYRRTGGSLDRDDGALLGFHSEGVRFESLILGERLVPWKELAALFIEALVEPEADGAAEGLAVAVDLVDGSRLRARFVRLDAEVLALSLGMGAMIEIPLERVELVTVDDGRLAYLSDFTPLEEIGRGSPFGDEIGLVFGHVMNRSVTGGDLVVGGHRFARGIGTHAPTRLLFDVPVGWSSLRGKVGVDDSTARLGRDALGSVRFRVKWNGELLWESPLVRGGGEVVVLPSLTLGTPPEGSGAEPGARRLELEVDPVEDFRGDRADWLELLLVR